MPAMVMVADSPLRRVDPRTKLAIGLATSLAVMLDFQHLVIALTLYVLFLHWGKLLRSAIRQTWQIRWVLLGLFIIDWLAVSLNLAAVVTLRMILLTGSFTLFFTTTTPGELRLALEWMRVPHRYAFSVSLAFQSMRLLDEEWRTIMEAQHARGAWTPPTGWRGLIQDLRDLVALSVPAIVLTTRRAWGTTEAAYARGFEAPHRTPYRQLSLGQLDWLLLAGTAIASVIFIIW